MSPAPPRTTTTSRTSNSSVAALYDVHGNPDALDAVLAEAGDAALVFGGDLAAGPEPAAALDRIMGLDAIVIRGNADRELLSGPSGGLVDEWVVGRLDDRHREFLAGLPETAELEVDGVGRVLFCHGSPRSDEELILRTTPDERLRDMLHGVEADVVVCGHTHMQFDRVVDGIRVVNAGSVGLAYGAPGAHWLALGPGVEHRRTAYDNEAFADRVAASDWPLAARFAEENIRNHPSEEEALGFFERVADEQWGERYPDSR
ncbi:MAG TPA: metallophosphoesterase family protein [Gaiellaceae bacterium]|nr:metallophosphoesterase family protein [Gaiellaceae bacterium]